MNDFTPPQPDPETITTYIRETYPETAILEMTGTWFFSLDPERHFPNFATIVTTDEHDTDSNLSRPGVFRLNIGVDRATFDRLAGHQQDPDYTALDRVLPHPVYARQHWISILNPSTSTFDEVVVPLLALAHDRLAAQRARHARR
jgi:hypothetical protein